MLSKINPKNIFWYTIFRFILRTKLIFFKYSLRFIVMVEKFLLIPPRRIWWPFWLKIYQPPYHALYDYLISHLSDDLRSTKKLFLAAYPVLFALRVIQLLVSVVFYKQSENTANRFVSFLLFLWEKMKSDKNKNLSFLSLSYVRPSEAISRAAGPN